MRKKVLIILLAGAALLTAALWQSTRSSEPAASGVITLPESTGSFKTVDDPLELVFPEDHGAHPAYQTEWWYFTGNLSTPDARRFGYQLTFFRRAIDDGSTENARTSAWAASQVYLAHFALTDVERNDFTFAERFSRGAAGLADGVGAAKFQVWLDDWSVEQLSDKDYALKASYEDMTLSLNLKDSKGIALQGDRGYSQKGAEDGSASMYYSLTRLESSGTLTLQGATYAVNGLSWMDHEWSTSALAPDQVGWDWFSIQLDDGRELMLYTIRKQDGSIDPFSNGMLVREDGSLTPLTSEQFLIQTEDEWRSPHTNAVYPSRWKIAVPEEQVFLEVRPLIPDQELRLSFVYWEGAVNVSGEIAGTPVSGSGYAELTGYAHSMRGQF